MTKIQRPEHEENEEEEEEEEGEEEKEVDEIPNGVTGHGRRSASSSPPSNASLLYSRQQIKELLTLCHVDAEEGVRFLFHYFLIITNTFPISYLHLLVITCSHVRR